MSLIWLFIGLGILTSLVALGYWLDSRRETNISLPTPQRVAISQVKEDEMGLYTYTFTLPPLGAGDVVKREMHVSSNGEVAVHDIDIAVFEHQLTFEEDANVEIFLVDIDDADNHSPNGEMFSFTVIDTIPPDAPSAVIVKDVEEHHEVIEEPVEEPVEEIVIEEPAEEIAEEVVEEAPVEEVAEEVTEEAPAEEVVEEAPAEEIAEEVIEPVAEEAPEVVEEAPAEEEKTE